LDAWRTQSAEGNPQYLSGFPSAGSFVTEIPGENFRGVVLFWGEGVVE
jgi:hypothetical protein